ncbi:hypothetical protein V6N12_028912 [Hibiscus sabdariffa]|uniref:Integrase catalytic domain-containing protein n=1 Tax=Hibiscus sabdariffa TaxID=183260 RepID=A0ABR2F763_9ROSI
MKEYVIEEPAANAPRADKDKFKKHMDNMVDDGCLMLATMSLEHQKQHEDMVAYEMIQNLKEIYEGQARQEWYETSKAPFQCKMIEGSPVGAQVNKMIVISKGDMKKSGSKSILMVRKDKGKKMAKPEGIEVKKAKTVGASVSGIYVIDVNMSTSTSWNQQGKSIKALRSDRGGEYLSQDFDELLKECGIISHLTPPGTPQWNGVSERRNRTLLDMVRSMMSHSDLSTSFWGHALETTAFTLNRVPSKSVQKMPYEMWTRKRPNMSFMKVWGCKAYVKHQMSTKLEPKSHKCTFVGYHKETKGYYFFNPKEKKCSLLEQESFSKENFSQRKGIEEIFNLKKFNNNRSMNQKLSRFLK